MSDLRLTIVQLPESLFCGERVARLRAEFEDQFGRKPDPQDEALGLEQLIWAAKLMTELGWA